MSCNPVVSPFALACLVTFAAFISISPSAAIATEAAENQAIENEVAIAESGEDKTQSNGWGKLLPLPIFVTEPAIGQGLGATLIYFHHDDEIEKPKFSTTQNIGKTGERSRPPPVATAVFGLYTNNDTAAVGVGHSNTFADDRFRLRAAAMEARINSDYYIGDKPIGFRLEGNLLFAEFKTRLGDSGLFFGVSGSYANASNNFRTDVDEIDGIGLLDFDFIDAGLAASLIYDTRDNTVLPADGFLVDITHWQYDESLGGDFNYDTTRLKALWFRELGEDFVLGLRADASEVNGEPPFFAYPYVRLRGIPALRYQGDSAGAVELEGRYHIGDRWSVSAFAGAGSVRIGEEQVETGDDIRTIGVGGRFLAFREQDAWVGIDVAQGPEDLVVYIQIGSGW